MIDFKTPNKEFIRLSDTSTGYSCGTGWVGPKPGDPSSPALLLATPVYGAVEVSWQYPTKNPGAVSHTKVFRNTTDDFSKATLLSIAQGNLYRDIDYNNVKGIRYYWIVVVSIHGTESEVIGPASAIPLSSIGGIIDELSGQINRGHLAKELQKDIEEIPKIEWLDSRLNQEVWDREFGHLQLIKNITTLTDNVDDVTATVVSEQGVRATADAALARAITEVSVNLDSSMASAVSSLEAGISKNADGIVGVARKIDEVTVEIDESMAQGFSTLSTMITKETSDREIAIKATSDKVDAVQVKINEDLSTAMNELTTDYVSRIGANKELIDANASNIATAQANIEDNKATAQNALTTAINKEVKDRNEAISVVSKAVTSVQSKVDTVHGPAISAVETKAETTAKTTNGIVTHLESQYTVKTNANGLIGGYGLYNDGRTIEMGFDVDKFWIGRSDSNKALPFVVNSKGVFLREAFIDVLSADKIDTRGLTIKDSAGNVIFGAGNNLDKSRISGLGALASKNSVTTGEVTGLGSLATRNNITESHISGTVANTKISGLGSLATRSSITSAHFSGSLPISKVSGKGALATIDKITKSNASTYIESAAIKMAMIGDLVVNTGHIVDGAITNLKIGDVIHSDNYVWNGTNSTGWALEKNGNFVVRGMTVVNGITTIDRLNVTNPNIIASGTTPYNSGFVREGIWYIDTGVTREGNWKSAATRQYSASAQIAGGQRNSNNTWYTGPMTAEVAPVSGFYDSAPAAAFRTQRIWIKVHLNDAGFGTGTGTIKVTSIDWKLVAL